MDSTGKVAAFNIGALPGRPPTHVMGAVAAVVAVFAGSVVVLRRDRCVLKMVAAPIPGLRSTLPGQIPSTPRSAFTGTLPNHLEIYDSDPHRGPEKVYAKHGAFLHDMEEFDHKFFGLTEVKHMDPQQRRRLEARSRAFTDADIDRKKFAEIDTAVYVGVRGYSSVTIASVLGVWTVTSDGSAFPAVLYYVLSAAVMTYDWLTLMSQHNALTMPDSPQMLANRVSFMLGRPSLTIDTACSSSLVATGNAVGEITEGEAYGGFVLGRHFDAWHAWEGAAPVAGSSVSEDGKSATLTVPNGLAQTSLLRDTHRIAGLMPHEVTSLKCAANGSALGDPIEFGAPACY